MSKQVLILSLIIAIAGFLRLYSLDKIPPSLSWDEVAQGYNAFSLGMTGKDEFGRSWPLDYLESFGDFKPVLYTYSVVIPVKIWGLNEFSTRFPSALFGTLTVLLSYFLVFELFAQRSEKQKLALLTAFIMAISPWHIQMSRAAFEANLGLFWVVLGMTLLLRGINGNRWSLLLSSLPFAATFYTFNSTRAFTPIWLFVIALLYRNQWKKFWRQGIIFVFFFIILLLPILPHLTSDQAQLRFREVNIFADLNPIEVSNARMAVDNNVWWSRILHNRRWMFTIEFLHHYFDNLNPGFLFIHGDGNPKFSIQDVGQMYLVDLPFFILGLFLLWKKYPREAKVIFLWLLVGIIPAATARETPHALRILQTIPTWQILIAIGIYEAYIFTVNRWKLQIRKAVFSFSLLAFSFNLFWYLHTYYAHYPKEFAGEWQYGYREAAEYMKEEYSKYDRITLTENLGRPYIFVLFYSKYSPLEFRKTALISRDVFGFVTVKGFDKYRFGGIELLEPIPGKKTLSVVSPQDVPKGRTIKKIIQLPSGVPVLAIYEN